VTARLIDGRVIAGAIRAEVAEDARRVTALVGRRPHLAAILIGDDPASAVYVRNKERACAEAGFEGTVHRRPADVAQAEVGDLIHTLNEDAGVDGILLQLPLPSALDPEPLLDLIEPAKDVDGLHPTNLGLLAAGRPGLVPCTPAGVQQLLIRGGVETHGARVTVVGRSQLVGTPLALLLSQKGDGGDATVTLCHSRTRDLRDHVRSADIVVAAIGRPEFITGDLIRPGAVVIDVGINRADDGRLVGDVHFTSAAEVAAAVTPVPGGVGPMTIACLLRNTLEAACVRRGLAMPSVDFA
jgi:methylenetetrahydrofolate dehydrogenase (NADP+)/methenyltetrahydrofolate cyclohydrolase